MKKVPASEATRKRLEEVFSGQEIDPSRIVREATRLMIEPRGGGWDLVVHVGVHTSPSAFEACAPRHEVDVSALPARRITVLEPGGVDGQGTQLAAVLMDDISV